MIFKSFITELNSLQFQKLFSIKKIDWWLLKHSDLFKELVMQQKSNLIPFVLEDGTTGRLPSIEDACREYPNEQEKFINLYNALDTIYKFHRNEKYFKQELIEYYKIKHSQKDLKKWVAKSEDLGAIEYVLFLVDYLDYSENPKHLNVYVHTLKELDIYIDRRDFESTIEFLEIFDDLYWVQEIYPESSILKRLESDMKKNHY